MALSGRSFEAIPEEAKQQLVKIRQNGATLRECIQFLNEKLGLNVAERTMYTWLKQLGVSKTAYRVLPFKGNSQEIEEEIAQKVWQDTLVESHKARASYYEKLYKESIKKSSGMDDLVQVAKETTRAIPSVKVQIPPYEKIHTTSTQVVVAPLCDTHIGEVVDSKQMGGLNSYNIDIFNNRLYNWVEKVNELTNLRRAYTRIDDLYVPLLGDIVGGEIHLELIKTNEDNVMGQMVRGANLISQALIKLASNFENVYVPCVVGNHGRMEIKPPAKNIYVSWDYLLFQWAAAFCRNQTNIHFEIPKSFFHIFTVAGRKILIMHGDSIKGGFAGLPYYGFNRAAAYLRQTLQVNRKISDQELFSYFDAMIIGHFHKQEELDLGTGPFIVAGCMKGADEYAFAKLHVASRPLQIVTFWHPKYGFISKDLVYLDAVKSDGKFVDVLSENWIDDEAIAELRAKGI